MNQRVKVKNTRLGTTKRRYGVGLKYQVLVTFLWLGSNLQLGWPFHLCVSFSHHLWKHKQERERVTKKDGAGHCMRQRNTQVTTHAIRTGTSRCSRSRGSKNTNPHLHFKGCSYHLHKMQSMEQMLEWWQGVACWSLSYILMLWWLLGTHEFYFLCYFISWFINEMW